MKEKMELSVTTICSKCGHEGQLYLAGDKLRAFHRSAIVWWWAISGWKMWLTVFTTAAAAGWLFGRWRP